MERCPIAVQAPLTQRIPLDTGWRYLANRTTNVAAVDSVPAARWAPVTLPHTWNRWDSVDPVPGYRRDAGWYRRVLSLPAAALEGGRRAVLLFQAANTVADVYVNGARAGGHVGGYLAFRVDVTPFVHPGVNDVSVRVDNADRPDLIPSNKVDFVIYGGLTRDVWLELAPPVGIGHVSVTTPSVSRRRASTIATVDVRHPVGLTASGYTVAVSLRAPGGLRTVARAMRTVMPRRDSVQRVVLALPSLVRPALWSPASPARYRVVVALRHGDTLVDRRTMTIGYRWFTWLPHGAFYLNGARLLLRGTHRHEEGAGYGGALPDAVERADMAAIRAMGTNFVRLAHYPQAPAVYDAADSLGLLVWDELPWNRGGVGGAAWAANTARLLREQIRQNGNHPSIILWSLGNEVHDVAEPGPAADVSATRRVVARLDSIAHALDPSRPTAMRKFDAGADLVDVYSPSIWVGWYAGRYGGYAAALRAARARWPRMVHMEYGADAHVGRHSEDPLAGTVAEPGYAEQVGRRVPSIAQSGDWSESYQTDLLDWHLMVSEHDTTLTGSAQWAFRDFATPLRPGDPIPYVNQKGLVDRAGVPKDAYYVFLSYWTRRPRFVYLLSHTWTHREGPPGVAREVRAYSNCRAVALAVDGVVQGTRRRDANDFPSQGLRWPVHFRPGVNRLVARCVDDPIAGDSVGDSLVVDYAVGHAGRPDHIALSTTPLPDGNLLVQALVEDAAGRRVLDDHSRVYFSYNGSGRLRVNEGTPTGSSIIETANGRAAVELVPPATGRHGEITARTQDLNGAHLLIGGAARQRTP